MSDKYEKHLEICENFNQVYRDKNSDYGDSFSRVWKTVGIISAYTRLADKFYRFESLVLNNKKAKIKDESIKDTLLDMANYCIMASMELDAEEQKDSITNHNF